MTSPSIPSFLPYSLVIAPRPSSGVEILGMSVICGVVAIVLVSSIVNESRTVNTDQFFKKKSENRISESQISGNPIV